MDLADTSQARRKRTWARKESPFPVLISATYPCVNWLNYTGLLVGDSVLITCSGDMDFIYKMGFFGKGHLSRSKPEYNTNNWSTVKRKKTSGVVKIVKVFSHRKQKRHTAWREYAKEKKTLANDPEYAAHIVNLEAEKDQRSPEVMPDSCVLPAVGLDCKLNDFSFGEKCHMNSRQQEDDWPQLKGDITDPWADNDEEASAAFWLNPTPMEPTPNSASVIPKFEATGNANAAVVDATPIGDTVTSTLNVGASDTVPKHSCVSSVEYTKSADSASPHKTVVQVCDNSEGSQAQEKHAEEASMNLSKDSSVANNGDVIVVEDSDEDNTMEHSSWLDNDPLPLQETLHLSMEEAFFLSYSLGCLLVYKKEKSSNLKQTPMKLKQMWQTFCQRQENFVSSYVAYHYLRSKGWVPKAGIKYGVDFILYKEGPTFCHSSYSVLVYPVEEGSLKERQPFSWAALSAINRITEQVTKEVMLCYVIKPKNLTSDLLASPKCIAQFKVQMILLKRHRASKERQAESDSD